MAPFVLACFRQYLDQYSCVESVHQAGVLFLRPGFCHLGSRCGRFGVPELGPYRMSVSAFLLRRLSESRENRSSQATEEAPCTFNPTCSSTAAVKKPSTITRSISAPRSTRRCVTRKRRRATAPAR